MAEDWSLEGELCKLAGVNDFHEALEVLQLIQDQSSHIDIRRSDSWDRGGAETYTYKFWVKENGQINKGYILKACVAYSPLGLDSILNEWIARRRLVTDAGVLTPRLMTYGFGVILEEFIEFELRTRLLQCEELVSPLLRQVASHIGTLLKLGFSPTNVLDDLRSRGNDVVMIDFGEDLGPPYVFSQPIQVVLDQTLGTLKKWGLVLPDSLILEIRDIMLLMSDRELRGKYTM